MLTEMLKKIPYLLNNPGIARYAGSIYWMFLDRGSRILITLVVSGFMLRYLGPVSFGKLSTAKSFVTIFQPIGVFGLDSLLIVYLVRFSRNSHRILASATALRLAGGFVVWCLTLGLCFFVFPDRKDLWPLIAIIGCMPLLQSFETVDSFYQARVNMRPIIIVKQIGFIASNVLRILMSVLGGTLFGFAALVPLEFLLSSSGLYVLAKKDQRVRFRESFSLGNFKMLVSRGWPVMFSGLAATVNLYADQVLLGHFMGDKAVGLYSAAVQLSSTTYYIPWILVPALFPAIINAKKNSLPAYLDRVSALLSMLTWMSVIIAIFTAFTSELIISMLFGQQFSESSGILRLHIWSIVPFFQMIATNYCLVVEGEKRLLLKIAVGAAILNIALNILLIPKFGIYGAIYATIVSYALPSLILPLLSKKSRFLSILCWKAFLLPVRLVGKK